MSGAAVLAGYGADLLVGDPPRWHPVAGFGRVASMLEDAVYAPTRARGAAFAFTLVGAAALAAELLARAAPREPALAAATWAALGGRSLRSEAGRIAARLQAGDLDGARAALRALCGRDAADLGVRELCRATVESVAENTSDAVVGALLWGALGGPAGVAAYRAANTLDAMVGHRSERYAQFGFPAARLDDLLSWPAARISVALTMLSAPVVGGSPQTVARITRRDGGRHPSPNAGQIEAAFAAALGVTLGGPLAYAGAVEHRPHLGEGEPPQIADIQRATRLSLAVGTAGAALGAAVASGRAIALSGHPGTMSRRATPGRRPGARRRQAARGLRPVPARRRHLVVTCAGLSGKSDHAPRRARATPPATPLATPLATPHHTPAT